MSDTGIVGDHQIRPSDDFRGSKPIAGAGNIGDAGVPSILLQDPLERAMLRAGADENDPAIGSGEQQRDQSRVIGCAPVA